MLQRFLLRQYTKVYRYDQWMRQHLTLSGNLWLIFMVAAAVFGIDTKYSSTYQLFVLLAMTFLVALIGSIANRLQVNFQRQLPRYGTVGEPLQYRVTLTNLTNRKYDGLGLIEQLEQPSPSYAQLVDFYGLTHQPWYKRGISFNQWRKFLIQQRGGVIPEIPLPCLGQTPLTITLSFTPLRRGKLFFLKSYLAKADSLGLFRRLIPLKAVQTCLILPRCYPVKPLLFKGKRQYQAGGVSLANSVGDSVEFMSLRDYHAGDPLSHVHWKSFAKHNRLIVKEYQSEYFVRQALLLDTVANTEQRDVFEAAVAVAASLASSQQQKEALLDLMFIGQQTYCFTSGRGVDHLPHLLEILASVQASEHDNFSQLAAAVLARAGQMSSFLCVLTRWDSARQQFIQQLLTHRLSGAVFLLHNGTMDSAQCETQPPHFYLLNCQQLAVDLAKIA